MNPLARYLDRIFFPVVSPVRLAVVRLFTGAYTVYYLFNNNRYLIAAAGGEPSTFSPVGLARLLDGPIDPNVFKWCVILAQYLSLLFAAGFWYRLVAPIFAALMFFVWSYSNSWSMVYHTENMLMLHIAVLALTPAAAALSFDAWDDGEQKGSLWNKVTFVACARPATEAHWIYGWSIVLMQLVATLPYVIAGIAKVSGGGFAWALGHNLRDQITMNGIYYEMLSGGAGEVTYHVYGHEVAFLFAASMTLVLELGAPLAILHRFAGYLYVAGIMGMHWSILALMGIPFPYQLYGAAFACFFEWEKAVPLLKKLMSRVAIRR